MHRKSFVAVALALTVASCAPSTVRSSSSDVEELLALHEQGLRAHRESDVELLLEAQGSDFTVSSNGQVFHPTVEESRKSLGPYLQSTRFSVYRDQIPPIVKVSKDGSLGWVIVQIEAKGEQTVPDGRVMPLEFVSSWISLYEKQGGRWVSVGNVSNFKPKE